nr:immunoglobulin heavy chain IgM1gj [Ginglymostoma cirratum]
MIRRMQSAISLSLLLTSISCVRSDIMLTQPEAETSIPGGSLKLTCKISGFDLEYHGMNWVRQIQGQGLEWLIYYYIVSDTHYNPGIGNRFTASKDISNNMIALDIVNLKTEDSAIYYCARGSTGWALDYWGQGTRVTVTEEKPFPPTLYGLISFNQQHNTGSSVTYVCLATDYSPDVIRVTWKKDREPIITGFMTYPSVRNKEGNYALSSQLTFTDSEMRCCKIYCEVRYSRSVWRVEMPDVPTCSLIRVNLLPPPIEQALLEATVTLTCIAFNVPHDVNISWTRGERSLKSNVVVQTREDPDSVVSKLNVSTQAWLSGDDFSCIVNHQDLSTPLRSSIHKKEAGDLRVPFVSILLPPTEEVSTQRFVSLTCFVRGFSPREIFVKWTNNDKPVNPSNYKNTEVTAQSDNASFFMYSLLSIAAEEWASGASYSCVVGHEAIPLKIINRTVDKSSGKPSFVNISLALMDTINSCQ